jgi:drug/metabolite transporter (DMT)-like permease
MSGIIRVMNWFLIALIAPFLWSIVNHVDKYLLSKYFKKGGVGALMIFSTLSAVLILPVAYVKSGEVQHIPLLDIIILCGAGIMGALAVFLYLVALQDEETTIIVPFWQLVPVFGYLFGYLFLGESLSSTELIAGLFIITGAVILSINLEYGAKNIFKLKITVLMMLSSLAFALYEAMFKYIAVGENFWTATFWEHCGLILLGATLFLSVKKYRSEFLELIKTSSTRILSLNIGSELLTFIGNILTTYAALLAPLALVLLVSAYQPIFVFIAGIILTIFLPSIAEEKLSFRFLFQKILAILIIFIGSYLLSF